MLELISDHNEINALQRELRSFLESHLLDQGIKTIGFPSGHASRRIYSNGDNSLYYIYSPPDPLDPIQRHFNSFGVFDSKANQQQITVEVNLPVAGGSDQVAGFFARDPSTDRVILMHNGRVGGGRKGIGKNAFLSFITDDLVLAQNDGRSRYGLAIGALDDPNLLSLLSRFVLKVREFKQLAARGDVDHTTLIKTLDRQPRYSPEFWGQKQSKRSKPMNYLTYHGVVVDALKVNREKTLGPKQSIGNTSMIDLAVWSSDQPLEIYEVKTSCDRQSLYAAIGQLMVHGISYRRRILVCPFDEHIPEDLLATLERINIEIMRYRISWNKSDAAVSFHLAS